MLSLAIGGAVALGGVVLVLVTLPSKTSVRRSDPGVDAE